MKNKKIVFRMATNRMVWFQFLQLHKSFRQSKQYKLINLIKCCYHVIQNERLVEHDGYYVINSFFPPLNSEGFYRIGKRVPGRGGSFYENHIIGKRLAPISAYFAVTHNCMYHCWHCSANSFMKNQNPDLSTKEFLSVVDQIKKLGVGIIGFTGGEPLLRKDLEQGIALAAKGKYMPCMTIVFTTGFGLTYERALQLKKAGLFAIAISVDHISEEDQDSMRGYKGAYRTSIEAIKNAKKAGLYTMSQTMCTRKMLQTGEIDQLAKYLKQLGIDEMRIMEPIPCGSLKEHRDEVLSDLERDKLILLHALFNHDSNYPKVAVFPYVESKEQYGCGAGSQHSFVDADGNFGPCDFINQSFGNMLEESAQSIWKRMHSSMGQPKCKCIARTKEEPCEYPKYYQLLAGTRKGIKE